ncbi:NmrA family NAD(P)-binding protein [Mucilaginibacter sp. CSA2-8R]|uniref:NmrA family NAD(P)-binding protein n=1 Tax=Mucilaginibacter sp. CSA2-8R TaxID=3141542 RepID=UPI00315DCD41
MKITIAGSLGNISKPLAQQLISAGHTVTVITSTADRQPAIEALGAQAAVGSVSDAAFLTHAFTGADAVYTMTPPNMGGANIIANTVNAGRAYAQAIIAAGVKSVVMLSSIGADQPQGTGPIRGVHQIEEIFRQQLTGVNITFLRAGFFYYNLFNDAPMIKNMHIMGSNYPADAAMPLVHPQDIAAAAAEELQKPGHGTEVRYIISDVKTGNEIAAALGQAIGEPQLPFVEFTDEQAMQGMQSAGLPTEMAELYTEMGRGFRTGIIPGHFRSTHAPVTGSIKLQQFAQEFAQKF